MTCERVRLQFFYSEDTAIVQNALFKLHQDWLTPISA
nr:MAG TPA: hypothetical protein [Caudoviricetes sp.]